MPDVTPVVAFSEDRLVPILKQQGTVSSYSLQVSVRRGDCPKWIAQAIFSRWWLKRYDFGPVEWLWRSLMYGRLQPMKSSTASA